MPTGKIRTFIVTREIGLIQADNGDELYFLDAMYHFSLNQRVQYDVFSHGPDRIIHEAINVRPLGASCS